MNPNTAEQSRKTYGLPNYVRGVKVKKQDFAKSRLRQLFLVHSLSGESAQRTANNQSYCGADPIVKPQKIQRPNKRDRSHNDPAGMPVAYDDSFREGHFFLLCRANRGNANPTVIPTSIEVR